MNNWRPRRYASGYTEMIGYSARDNWRPRRYASGCAEMIGYTFFYRLGCLALSLRFWPKNKQFLSNCPQIWVFSFKTADFCLILLKSTIKLSNWLLFRNFVINSMLRWKIELPIKKCAIWHFADCTTISCWGLFIRCCMRLQGVKDVRIKCQSQHGLKTDKLKL